MRKKTRGSKTETKQFDLERFMKRNRDAAESGLEKAKENKGGFTEYEDGRYRLRYVSGEIRQASSSKRVGFLSKWKILDGDYKGQAYTNWRNLSDAKGVMDPDMFGWFLGDLRRLGYDVDELELDEVPDLLKQIKKDHPTVIAALKTKGEFQNLNIVKLVDEDDEDEDEDETDDEKPRKKKGKSRDDDEDDESDDDEDSDDEDEKPKRKKKGKSKDDDDEDDSEEEDDEEEDDEDEKPKKKRGRKSKDDDEDDEDSDDEDDEDDEDEEEEEEKPRRKKKKGKKDDDEDEDENDDEDDSEEVAVTVGSIAKVKLKDGVQKCEVVEVLEDDQAIKVKTKEGKTVKVGSDKILDVEEPKKKRKKR